MTLFELLVVVGFLSGAVNGAAFGMRHHSVPLAVVGALVGAPFGVLAMGVPLALLGGILSLNERRARRRALRPFFGTYWTSPRAGAWREVSERLRPGTRVRGRVVGSVHAMVVLDVGAGFPVALPVHELAANPERGREAIPHAPGDVLEAFVTAPEAWQRWLIAAVHEPEWIRFEGSLVGSASSQPWTQPGAFLAFTPLKNDAHAALVARSKKGPVTLEVVRGLEVLRVEVRARGRRRLEVVSPVT